MVISSRVKITCYLHVWRYEVFGKAHLVFHWCLYNKTKFDMRATTGQLYPGRDTFEFDQGHVTKNHPSHSVHFAGWKSSYVTTKFWWTVIISACWKKTRTSQPSLNSRIHWTSSHLASAKIHPSQSHEAESKSENTLKSCSTFKGISFRCYIWLKSTKENFHDLMKSSEHTLKVISHIITKYVRFVNGHLSAWMTTKSPKVSRAFHTYFIGTT